MSAQASAAAHKAVRGMGFGRIAGNRIAVVLVAVLLVAMLFVPTLHNDYYNILVRGILMFGAMSMGWNIIGGYAGYVSFGNVVFFGLGAYASAVTSEYLHQTSPVLGVVFGCIIAVVLAVALGIPILRLRGHYFGIATLGLALATEEIIANVDWLGGGSGMTLKQDTEHYLQYYYAMWLVCAASFAGTWFIARSKLGYALVAIRENEEAAIVLGVNATRYKIVAWALSGMMAASAGAVYAFANGFIDPPTAFLVDNNVFPIVMAILGGLGTVAGPMIGALVLTAINENLWSRFPEIHTLFFGLAIVLIVMFLPRGLLALASQLKGGWRGFVSGLGAYRV